MKIFDVEIRIHWSWWIFCLIVCFGSIVTLDFNKLITDVSVVASLALIVLGHEMSHVLAAKHFGFSTKRIYLHLLGGLAMINVDTGKLKPAEDFWISFAGPAFNIVSGLIPLLCILLNPFESMYFITEVGPEYTTLGICLATFSFMNLIVGVFNLIPAYPMDGGRMLRAVLSEIKDPNLAKNIAHGLSIFFSVVFLGLSYFNPLLSLLSFILIVVVWAERKHGTRV